MNQFLRTEYLFGKDNMRIFENSKIAVFGIGGVGGYVVEALVRSGIGAVDLIDNDRVSVSNINRQIIATMKTVGMYKADVMKERVLDINPNIKVKAYKVFYMPDTSDQFDFSQYDYVVDAIDTVTGKIELIINAQNANVPIISSMGAGNKVNPTEFKVADIFETSVCPLAKVMRRELKKRGVRKLKVVYSQEKPIISVYDNDNCENDFDFYSKDSENSIRRKQIPGSAAFVPSVAGLIIAGEVLKDLSKL